MRGSFGRDQAGLAIDTAARRGIADDPGLGAGKPQLGDGAVPMVTSDGAVTLPGMFVVAFHLVGAVFNLNGRPHYIHSGWFLISVGNLVVIVAMIAVFVLALVLPFPGRRRR
jgi:hypothetical protein